MAKTKEELREEQINKKIQLKEDYTKVFSTVEGKRVLADLEAIGFSKGGLVFPEFNTNRTFYNAGLQDFANHIKNVMNLDIKELKKQPEPIIDEVEE